MQSVSYGEVWLIPKDFMQDEIGQPIDIERQCSSIPCEEYSVSRTDWTAAQQGGYDSDIQLKVFAASYHGEKEAFYNGVRYTIYRTYRPGDMMELYLSRKVGDM